MFKAIAMVTKLSNSTTLSFVQRSAKTIKAGRSSSSSERWRYLQRSVYSRIPQLSIRTCCVPVATSSCLSKERQNAPPWSLLVAAAVLSSTLASSTDGNSADCCGIAAVVGRPGSKQDARDFLVEGLTVLKNRGYDSAGIATIDVSKTKGDNRLTVTKYASNGDAADGIELVKEHSRVSSGHSIGIAHTR